MFNLHNHSISFVCCARPSISALSKIIVSLTGSPGFPQIRFYYITIVNIINKSTFVYNNPSCSPTSTNALLKTKEELNFRKYLHGF